MSEQTKATPPADEITKSSEENTIELTEKDLDQVAGGVSSPLAQTVGWK
jgi:bacteriocin-like protein